MASITGLIRTAGTGAVGAAALLLGACGSTSDYANKPRPPSAIVISAYIGPERVSVSPRKFGAGPVTIVVTNQTRRSQELTLETDTLRGGEPGIRQNSGPINPGDTASLKAELKRGTYKMAVG